MDKLVERKKLHGNWYGSPLTGIVDALTQDKIAIMPLGFAGAKLVKAPADLR